jgi:hypothetical protein
MPHWLNTIANIFPVKALADGLQHVFDPRVTGAAFNVHDLRTLLVWTVAGIVAMVRFLGRPAEPA